MVAERAVAVLGSLGRRVQTVVEAVLAAIGRVVVRCRVMMRPIASARHGIRGGTRRSGRLFGHGVSRREIDGQVEVVVQSKSCHSTSLDVLEHFAVSERPQCFHATRQRRYGTRLSVFKLRELLLIPSILLARPKNALAATPSRRPYAACLPCLHHVPSRFLMHHLFLV